MEIKVLEKRSLNPYYNPQSSSESGHYEQPLYVFEADGEKGEFADKRTLFQSEAVLDYKGFHFICSETYYNRERELHRENTFPRELFNEVRQILKHFLSKDVLETYTLELCLEYLEYLEKLEVK